MNSIRWFIAALSELFLGNERDQGGKKAAIEKEAGAFEGTATERSKDFDNKYNIATQMLKNKMHARFPDNFYAKPESGKENMHNYSEARASAVDKSSAAIAIALRNGDNVQQAAAAGAASVGI